MSLQSKGFWIWKIRDCENGEPEAIAAQAVSSGFTHVMIKIADGAFPQNLDRTNGADLVASVSRALKNRGIQVWGWHYIYGDDPAAEARMAIQRLQPLALDGYIIDAEGEIKQAGENAVRRFMKDLRASFPSLPVALSSYRYPSYHPQLPWKAFLEYVDINMPQVYWEQSHNSADQLDRSVKELMALTPSRPVIPTAPAYKVNGWRPTPQDILQFMHKARRLHLPAVNFFSWDECRHSLPEIWDCVSGYDWNGPLDICEEYIAALNLSEPSKIASLYSKDAVLVCPNQTIQGQSAIKKYFEVFLGNTLPQASFTLVSSNGEDQTRNFSWFANSPKRSILNGKDTLGLLKDKIIYHYTYYS